jgi:hypothetical protein
MREGKVGARQLHASMPWWFFGKMTDDDLKSMFAYLRTLKPVKHRVDNTAPPTPCKLGKAKHGVGEQNQTAAEAAVKNRIAPVRRSIESDS